MRTVYINLDSLNDTYFLGYTGEHQMTRVDLVVPAELAEATGYSLEFDVCGTQRIVSGLTATEGVVSYLIPYDITSIISRRASVALQLTGYIDDAVIGKSAVVNGYFEQGLTPVEVDDTLIPIVTEVHQNTASRHSHTNKEVLDLFGIDEHSNLLWNEEAVIPDLSEYVKANVAVKIGDNISFLYNDAGYITEAGLATYAKKSEIPTVPTNVSDFVNDAGYLTQHQSLADYALKAELPTVPTAVSAFTNDAGYLTQHQSLTDYATKTYVDTAIQGAIEGSY